MSFSFPKMVALVMVSSFFFPSIVYSAECLTQNLSLGKEGEEVRKLQQILNMAINTRVSDTGLGSLGNETTYFGQKTRSAVVRFQEFYRDEVLVPAGLSAGSGYVGAMTRKKLNTLCSQGSIGTTIPPLPLPISATTSSKGVYVFYPSEYSGVPGVLRTISGDGFVMNVINKVYFGPYMASGTPQSGSALQVIIPQIPPGKYPLWVENQSGVSNKDSFFIVRDPMVPEPVLLSITPSSGKAGTKVQIRGTGFTPSNNTLHTGVDVVRGVSSNDGIIEWTVPDVFAGGNGTTSLPVWIYVVNDRGVSKELVFQMKI